MKRSILFQNLKKGKIIEFHIFQAQTNLLGPTRTPDATPNAAPLQVMYPGLAEYMGLELSDDVIRQNMPEYLEQNRTTAMIQLPQVMIFRA